MASIRFQVIGTNKEYVSKGNGKGYNKLTVTYKNLETNKVEVKTLMDFTYPDVFKVLDQSKTNDTFQATSEKVNNFWTWVEIHRDDGPVPDVPASPTQVHVGGKPVSTNTYAENNAINKERLEFDRQKQPLIIRQSCISSAVALLGNKASVEQVLETAARFEEWVNGNTIGQMADDIPE